MATLEKLEKEIAAIKARNAAVEADKSWETSWTRKGIVFLLTYTVIAVYFMFAHLPDPWLNAVVPALAFVLSTLILPFCKRVWLRRIYRR